MKNLIPRVIQWAEESNFVNPADIQSETLMMISKFGKISDVIVKSKSDSDEIGDCLISLIIICRMRNISLVECLDYPLKVKDERFKNPFYVLVIILSSIGKVSERVGKDKEIKKEVCYLIIYLTILAALQNLTLLECLEYSFKNIQNKKIIKFNGVILTDTDEDYHIALKVLQQRKDNPNN